MNKFYTLKMSLFAALGALVAISCNVDEDYDLSNLSTDNLGLGNSETVIDLTLARVKIDVSDLTSSDGSSVAARSDVSSYSFDMSDLETINAFLPSDLTGTDYEDGIDLTLLNSDSDYTAGLVDILFEELATNDEKREEFSQVLIDNNDDIDDTTYSTEISLVETLLGLEDGQSLSDYTDASELSTALGEALVDEEKTDALDALKESVTTTVQDQTADITTDYDFSETVDAGLDIGDILDMLASDDDDSSYLNLFQTTETNIPMTVTITPSIASTAGVDEFLINKYSDADDYSVVNKKLSGSDLSSILSSMVISANINFNYYNPANGTLDLDGKYVVITLIVRKYGAIKL